MTNLAAVRGRARAANARPLAEDDFGVLGPRQSDPLAPRTHKRKRKRYGRRPLVLGADAPRVGARITEGFNMMGGDE